MNEDDEEEDYRGGKDSMVGKATLRTLTFEVAT